MSDAKRPEAKKPEAKKDQNLVVIKVCKMAENMADIAVKTMIEGLEQSNDLHQAADYVKKKFEADKFVDEASGEKISTKGVWHCCIGRKFGAFVTFAEGNYIQFYYRQLCVIIWKSS
uniref:Dynein light chain n=1 Tax=Lotharella oceanica TaxID=641309 RepID=A0A7S2TGU3_9EUKA